MKTNSKILFVLLLVTIFSISATAQDKKTVPSSLKGATVFFQGAELTHSASAKLQKGENEIYIEGLSPVIENNSLTIKTSHGVVVTTFEYSIDYLSESKSSNAIASSLKDSIAMYEKQLDQLNVDINITSNLISLLQKGTDKNVAGSESGMKIDELLKTMESYKAKSKELQNIQSVNYKKQRELNDSVARLKVQLQQESLKNSKKSGILKLNLSSPAAIAACDFTISYYTKSAGWTPYHEINIASTDAPVKIITKSKVFQTTGLDWDKVKLTLSTSVPSNGKVAPTPNLWMLNYSYYTQNNTTSAEQLLQGRVAGLTAVQDTVDPQASAMRIRGGASISGDNSPLVVVDGVANVDINSIPPENILSVETLKDASAAALYGSRGANGVVLVTTINNAKFKNKTTTIADYIVQTETELNQVYAIDLPYTIPGNGKDQKIPLYIKETKADYTYYCVPRLDKATYLLAEITDWAKLKLLSGAATVTYDGTYIGETYINANSTEQKLSLTLGTDERISVKRERVQDYSSSKLIGSDVKQEFTYKITVKNNQNKPVKLVMKDQYPVSANKNITVEFSSKSSTGWTDNNKDTGILSWEGELKAGETKDYQMSYSVKYPQGAQLNF